MPKGKKFDAAEKHFAKIEERYKYEIKSMRAERDRLAKELGEAREKIANLEAEKQSLEDWAKRLLEYTELTPEDIKTRVENDKKAKKALESLEVMTRFLTGF